MNLLIDSLSLQARVHLHDGRRLATLLENLAAHPGVRVDFAPPAALSADTLKGQDVLLLTTRKPAEADYAEAEIVAIADFVRCGGGLLLMSNHGDIPGRPYPDLTASDARLARRFGVELENAFFAAPEWGRPVEIRSENLNLNHPALAGIPPQNPVRALVINNCASIRTGPAAPLAFLPQTLVDHRDGRSPASRCLAVALDRDLAGGRVVVTADSGFIGSPGTTFPGVGLLGRGDNLRFVVNTLLWLGGT